MLDRLEISMPTIKLEMPNCIALQCMLSFYCTVVRLWGHVEMLISTHIIIHGYTGGRRCKCRIDWPPEKNFYSLLSFNVCDYEKFPHVSLSSEKSDSHGTDQRMLHYCSTTARIVRIPCGCYLPVWFLALFDFIIFQV